MSNWFEVYPEQEGAKLDFDDFPTKEEIFERLQNTGLLSLDANVNDYEIDSDCSFIGIYNTEHGELVYKFEIE